MYDTIYIIKHSPQSKHQLILNCTLSYKFSFNSSDIKKKRGLVMIIELSSECPTSVVASCNTFNVTFCLKVVLLFPVMNVM